MTPAKPETAARLGNRPQGPDEAVLGLAGELSQARVERWWQPGLRWPESTTASFKAAAGVRVNWVSVLGSTAGGKEGCYGLLGVH